MTLLDWAIIIIVLIAIVVIAKIVREILSIVLGIAVTVFILSVALYLLAGASFFAPYASIILSSKIGFILYLIGKYSVGVILQLIKKLL